METMSAETGISDLVPNSDLPCDFMPVTPLFCSRLPLPTMGAHELLLGLCVHGEEGVGASYSAILLTSLASTF